MIRGIRWTILGISLLWQWPMPLSAQLPPRGITPTPTRPRQTPSPTVQAPVPTIPVVISPTPTPTSGTQTGIWTQWRVTVEYRETLDGPWIHFITQQEQGTDRKVVTVTLWRYRQ